MVACGWRMWRVEGCRLVSPYVTDHRRLVMPDDGTVTSDTGVYYWPAFKTAADFAPELPTIVAMPGALTFGVADGWIASDDDPREGRYGALRSQQFTSRIVLVGAGHGFGGNVAASYPELSVLALTLANLHDVDRLARATL